ncbi:MAG TPA: ABC transporter permease subunit [bacterium]|nr:ABC transporter permease subunit [bacterium]
MISAAPVRGSRWVGVVPVSMLLLVLFPLLLMPLAAIFIFAGRSGLDKLVAALSTSDAQFAMRFSLLIAFGTALVNGVLGTFAAYVLSKYQFRGREALGVVVNLPVAIPTVVVGTSLLLLWGPIGLLGQYLDPLGIQPMFAPVGVLLAHLFVTFPYMLGAVKPVLDELDVTYEEAAYTIGARRWQTFRFVILPALRGGLFSGTLLTFAHSLGEFGATVLVSGNLRLRTQTAPLYIFAQFEAGNIESANAVAAVLAILSFALFFILLRVTQRRPAQMR